MGHLDPKQPPVKRKPYAAILTMPFIHKAELILPKELYEIMKDDLGVKFTEPVYSRVILPLSALLEGDFFNEYIKKGNVLMLSEGTHGVDDVYYLKDGVLTLTLGKESYERAGLVGKPDGVKGERHTKPRWIVEINLRLPAMLHGKKGFDRIVYAFKNVISRSITWLLIDLQAEGLLTTPLTKHFPTTISCSPKVSSGIKVEMPDLQPPSGHGDKHEDEFDDFAESIYEWLSLVSLESPRVAVNDRIDSFLSRYSPPVAKLVNAEATELIKITWEGFLSPSWVHTAFVQTLLAVTSKTWCSLAVTGFNESLPTGSRDCTVVKLPSASNEYILWEVEHA